MGKPVVVFKVCFGCPGFAIGLSEPVQVVAIEWR